MDTIKERIMKEASIFNANVLKLDSILNHGADPILTMEMGKAFAARFAGKGITKIVTIESSGIPVAFATAYAMGVPLVFARRKKTLISGDDDVYAERVPSFTKGIVSDLIISRELLKAEDNVLFIDDIIANGDAARGIIRIIEQSGAKLGGVGIVIEKSFQAGGKSMRETGVQVETLVKVRSLEGNQITFED